MYNINMGKGKSAIVKITPVTNPGIYLYNCILDYSAYGETGIDALLTSLKEIDALSSENDYLKLRQVILKKLKSENVDETEDSFHFYIQPTLLHKILQLLGLTYEQVISYNKTPNELSLFQIQLNKRLSAIERSQLETFQKLSSMKNNSKRFSTQKKLFLVLDIMEMIGFQLDGTTSMQGKQLGIKYKSQEYYYSAKGFQMATSSNEYMNLDSKATLRAIAFTLYVVNNDEAHKGKTFSIPADIAVHLKSKVIYEPSVPSPEEKRNHPFIYATAFSLYAYLDSLKNYFSSVSMNYEANLHSLPNLKYRRQEIIEFLRDLTRSITKIKNKYLELLEFMTNTESANTFSDDIIEKCIENMAGIIRKFVTMFSPVKFFYENFDSEKNATDNFSFNISKNEKEFISCIDGKQTYYFDLLNEIYFETESFVDMVKNEYGRS